MVSAAASSEVSAPANDPDSRRTLRLLAEAAGFAAVLGLAVVLRLTALGDATDLSDEGIRGVQLRLLAAGFAPVSEIYASQGPLSLWLFWPLTALFGPDIVVARMTVVIASLVILLGAAWIARVLGGPLAGVAAATVLAVSPVFLENSRLAFVEAPSLAPTVLAICALLRFRQTDRRAWLIGSAVLLAVGTLAKPMAAVAAAPAMVLLAADRDADGRARHWRVRLTDLLLYGVVGAAVCASVIVAVGPLVLYEQVIAYRLGARAAQGWNLAANGETVVGELARSGWGSHLAALLGVVTAVPARRSLGLAVLAWTVVSAVALLLYSPLWPKHLTYLITPLAILAGVGIGQLTGLLGEVRDWRRLVPAAGAIVALLVTAVQVPAAAAENRSIVYRHAGSDLTRYADDLAVVRAATRPGEFVVVDDAYLAMLTERLVPPLLADLSTSRIGARALSADQSIAETERFNARVLILQDDHLGGMQRYLQWADREYLLVKNYVQRRPNRYRRVYLARDADAAPVKTALLASLEQPTDVALGPAALLAYELESRKIKTGSRVDLTLLFEALQDRAPEHALLTRLRDTQGETAWEGQWKIGDGSQELHTWKAGQWQLQTMRLLVDDVPAGEYVLTIGLERPKGGVARVTARSGAEALPDGEELSLGRVTLLR